MSNASEHTLRGQPVVPDPNIPEVASVVTKISAVWAGTLFGIQLSDLVLLVTLAYTLVQLGLLVWDRVIKPWRAHRHLPRKSDSFETEY